MFPKGWGRLGCCVCCLWSEGPGHLPEGSWSAYFIVDIDVGRHFDISLLILMLVSTVYCWSGCWWWPASYTWTRCGGDLCSARPWQGSAQGATLKAARGRGKKVFATFVIIGIAFLSPTIIIFVVVIFVNDVRPLKRTRMALIVFVSVSVILNQIKKVQLIRNNKFLIKFAQ